MRFVPLCELELRYTDVEFVDYCAGGQSYGHLERTLEGDDPQWTRKRTGDAKAATPFIAADASRTFG